MPCYTSTACCPQNCTPYFHKSVVPSTQISRANKGLVSEDRILRFFPDAHMLQGCDQAQKVRKREVYILVFVALVYLFETRSTVLWPPQQHAPSWPQCVAPDHLFVLKLVQKPPLRSALGPSEKGLSCRSQFSGHFSGPMASVWQEGKPFSLHASKI